MPATTKKPTELARHCQNLEDELDVVKKEILKILSEKTKCSKENEELKKALLMTDQVHRFFLANIFDTSIMVSESKYKNSCTKMKPFFSRKSPFFVQNW
jgi:hypothetical protein